MNLRMCLNWKVLGALAALAIGFVALAPSLASAALPILLLAVCPLSMLVMAFGMSRMGGAGGNDTNTTGQQYTCPMHPEVTSATPGRCPTCGMALVAAQAPREQLPALRAKLSTMRSDEAALAREIAMLEQMDSPRADTRAAVSEAKR